MSRLGQEQQVEQVKQQLHAQGDSAKLGLTGGKLGERRTVGLCQITAAAEDAYGGQNRRRREWWPEDRERREGPRYDGKKKMT
jgi:hypothetical protein